MVMKRNREKVINELIEKTKRSNEECNIIYEVLEKHSIVGRKNKEKIIADFMEKLNISENEANEIYNITTEIVLKEFFNK